MHLLVSANELSTQLGSSDIVVVDCRFNLLEPAAGRELWAAGHIPGAYYADLNEDLAAPVTESSGRHPLPLPEQLSRLFASWGLTPERQLVAYDADGGAIAARLWWLARWAGHTNVSLLDGGYPAWLAAGHPVAADIPETHTGAYPIEPNQWPIAATADVLQAIQSGGGLVVVDARAAPRFAGKIEPIDSKAGHIPGAINWPFSNNLDESGRFKPAAVLADALSALPAPDQHMVSMCGSGVTACHTLFAMELAGLIPDAAKRPALYVGSWSEWIRDDTRPVVGPR